MTTVLQEPVFQSATDLEVWVSSAGSDTTGSGSVTNPYATVRRALKDVPTRISSSLIPLQDSRTRIRIIPPYTGPGFSYSIPQLHLNNFQGTQNSAFGLVTVEAYPVGGTGLNTLTDPRFTYTATAITPIAVAQTASCRTIYTLPPGTITITDQWVGQFVRVWDATRTTELSRGIIYRTDSTTQRVWISWRGTTGRTGVITDSIDVCDLAVVLNTTCNMYGGNLQLVSIKVEPTTASAALGISRSTGFYQIAQCIFKRSGTVVVNINTTGNVFFSSSGTGISYDALLAPCTLLRDPSTNGSVVLGGTSSYELGTVCFGQVQSAASTTTTRSTSYNNNVVVRGSINMFYEISRILGTTAVPFLVTPNLGSGLVAPIQLRNSSAFKINGSSNVIAIDVEFFSGGAAFYADTGVTTDQLRFVPADAGFTTLPTSTPVINVPNTAQVLVDPTSTLLGGSGVDVIVGSQPGISFSALAALPDLRVTDTWRGASVIGGPSNGVNDLLSTGPYQPHHWQLNGDVTLAPTSAGFTVPTAGLAAFSTAAADGQIDNWRFIEVRRRLNTFAAFRRTPGSGSGTTTLVLMRFNSATAEWSNIATLNIPGATAGSVPVSASVGSFVEPGDYLAVCLTSIEAGFSFDLEAWVTFR